MPRVRGALIGVILFEKPSVYLGGDEWKSKKLYAFSATMPAD